MQPLKVKRPSGGRDSRIGKMRQQLAEQQGWLCFWCRRKMVLADPGDDKYSPLVLTADHVMPLSRGGRNSRYNLVAACSQCNKGRAAKGDPSLYVPPWLSKENRFKPPEPERRHRRPGCDIRKRLRKYFKQQRKRPQRTTLGDVWPAAPSADAP